MVKEREINLEGHTELVDALDFCPTKNYLLSGSKDTTVRLWDVEKKDLKKIFRKHQKQVCAARWLQENKFASAGFDKCIKICDTETGKVVSDFKDRDWILDLKVNPRDKNLLLVCGAKGICSLWDVRRKEAVFQAKEPEGRSWGSLNFTVDWDPYNTDHYAVGNGAGSITIWDKRKLKAESVKNFETDYGAINSLAFNPVVKNVIVAAVEVGAIVSCDTAGSEKQDYGMITNFNNTERYAHGVAFNKDGFLATGSPLLQKKDKSVYIFEDE